MTRAERLVMEMRCCDPDGNREALTVGEARALFSDLAVMDAENERLRDALKEIMRSPKCNNPSCTIDNPLCNTMIAVAALKGGDE